MSTVDDAPEYIERLQRAIQALQNTMEPNAALVFDHSALIDRYSDELYTIVDRVACYRIWNAMPLLRELMNDARAKVISYPGPPQRYSRAVLHIQRAKVNLLSVRGPYSAYAHTLKYSMLNALRELGVHLLDDYGDVIHCIDRRQDISTGNDLKDYTLSKDGLVLYTMSYIGDKELSLSAAIAVVVDANDSSDS